MYRKWYKEAQRQLDNTRRELENFKEAVYEKEVVKNLKIRIIELEKNLAVSEATKYAYGSCAETLTKALNNITTKNG